MLALYNGSPAGAANDSDNKEGVSAPDELGAAGKGKKGKIDEDLEEFLLQQVG